MIDHMKLKSKFLLLGISLSVIPILIIGILVLNRNEAIREISVTKNTELSYAYFDGIIRRIRAECESQAQILTDLVTASLNVAREELKNKDGFLETPDKNQLWHIVNQYTKVESDISLPSIKVGDEFIVRNLDMAVNTPVVDRVTELTGVTCTIFQRMNPAGDMLRVATTVPLLDGTRAIGTYIPAINPNGEKNPVVDTVLSGNTYKGRAYVVNQWYITAYEPIMNSGGEIRGMLYVGVPQKSLTVLKNNIMNIRLGETGFVFIMDKNASYVISDKGKRDGENLNELKNSEGRFFISEMVKDSLAAPDQIIEKRYLWKSETDTEMVPTIARVIGFKPWNWVIGVSIPEKEFYAGENQIKDIAYKGHNLIIIIGLITLILTVIIWFTISDKLSRRIGLLENLSRKIADGDLTEKIDIKIHDELGSLMENMNRMTTTLMITTKNTVQIASSLSYSSDDLIKTAENMVLSTEEIAYQSRSIKRSTDQINESINAVAASSEETSSVISGIAAMSEEMSATVKTVAEHADGTAANVSEMAEAGGEMHSAVENVAAAVEEMSMSLSEVAGYTVTARSISESASNKSEGMKAKMTSLSVASAKINKIVDLIKNITDQTNMLALNAAIEAAGAGAAGKGFAVVAGEVKNLAQKTSQATEDISGQIEGIQQSVSDVMKSIGDIHNTIGQNLEINKTIGASVEEQTKTMGEIAENIAGAAGLAKNVSDRSGKSSLLVNEIAKSTKEIAKTAYEMAKNIEEASFSSKEIARAGNDVALALTDITSSMNEFNDSMYRITDGSMETKRVARDMSQVADKLSEFVKDFNVGEIKFDIGKLKIAHLRWRSVIEGLILKLRNADESKVSDHTHCDFGKWYYSDEGRKFEGNELYHEIGEMHKGLHDLGNEIIMLCHENNHEEANAMMELFEEKRRDFFNLLEKWYIY